MINNFEDNFKLLKEIAKELNESDLNLDELLKKGELAQSTAKNCLKILKEHKGKFEKLELELDKITNDISSFTEDSNSE